MRICDLCESKSDVEQFVIAMQPLADKPVTPHEVDLCEECAHYVYSAIKTVLHTSRKAGATPAAEITAKPSRRKPVQPQPQSQEAFSAATASSHVPTNGDQFDGTNS